MRSPYGNGWHLDRVRFDARLADTARAAGARLLKGRHIVGARRQETGAGGWWRLTLADAGTSGEEVAARFVVDATGRASAFARCHAGAQRVRDDRLVALAGRLRAPSFGSADAAPERQTVLEATPEGWWYLAPVPRGGRVVVFHTDADLPAASSAPDPARWLARLADTTEVRIRLERTGILPDRAFCSPPPLLHRCCAASSRLEPGAAGAGWLAVGDAALAFDPLSSHGICSALWTGILAAEAITAHWCDDDLAALPRYAAEVRACYAEYRSQWDTYYALERRWPDAPFWQRRHASGPTAAVTPTR
jgi:flavin-dependent dehydrogenase